MTLAFFPRSRTFWLYHCSVLLAVVAITAGINLIEHKPFLLNLVGMVVWLPLMTCAVLVFRKAYKTTRVGEYGTWKFILAVIFYGLAAGLVVTLLMIAITLPLFLDEITATIKNIPDTSYGREMAKTVLGNTLQTQLFVCLWIFIYASISNYRRKQEMELVNLRLQNSLKEAQLHSLANQLNPHFLFNALNNIRFMMQESVARADDMVVNLSDILRHSLETSRREKIPLAQELQIIGRYIDLVKIQFDDRLRFDLSIAAGLEDCLTPPMILQLLVENAVKHGADRIRSGAAIALSASAQAGQLLLRVENDVPAAQAGMPRAGTGTGLHNIEQRLHLLYGSRASLASSIADGRFVASIALPLERTS